MEAHDDELEPAAAAGDDPIPGTTPVPDPPPVPVTSPVSGLYDGPAKPVRLGSAPFGTRPASMDATRKFPPPVAQRSPSPTQQVPE